jgi:hypothetical protein
MDTARKNEILMDIIPTDVENSEEIVKIKEAMK